MSKLNTKHSHSHEFEKQIEKIEKLIHHIQPYLSGTIPVSLQKNIQARLENALLELEKIESVIEFPPVPTSVPDSQTQPLAGEVEEKSTMKIVGERMEFMLNEAPTVLYTASVSVPYGVTYISQNAQTIMGYQPEEFTQDPAFWSSHIHPDDIYIVNTHFQYFFSQGSYKIEYRFRFKDGTYHWLYDQCRLTYDAEGQINGIVGCMIDVTEKKEAEAQATILLTETQTINEELRASEEELLQTLDKTIELNERLSTSEQFNKRVISSVNEGIVVFDKDLRYVIWNTYLEKRMSLSQAEVIGKRPDELFPYLEAVGMTHMLKRALAGETIIVPDTFVRSDSSKAGWITGSYSPLINTENEIIGVIGVINIITERKTAEIALLEQKNLLQAFYNTAHFHMCVFELTENDFIYKLPNQYLANFFGKTVEELTGRTGKEIGLPQNVIDSRYNQFKNCLETGKTMQSEYAFPRVDGTYGWHFGSFSPITGENTISFISIDITERKQIEEEKNRLLKRLQELNKELENSQSKLKESQKIARLGTWEFNIATGETVWSEEVFRIFGLDPSSKEPDLETYQQMIDPQFRKMATQSAEQAITSGKEFEMEIKILPADVAFRWNFVIGRPVFDTTGQVMKMMGVSYDITEAKIAQEKIEKLLQLSQEMNNQLLASEEELRQSLEKTIVLNEQISESERRWQFALEGSGDGLWDWDLLSNQFFYSKRFKELLGFREDEVVEGVNNWALRIHPHDKENVFEEINSYLHGTLEIYQSEYRALSKGNQYRWFMGRGKVVEKDQAGKPLRMIGTMSDITERKQIAEKLKQQNEDLKKINQELDSFVYRASHDLRAPLASILGLINISRLEEDEAIKASYLNMMEKSIVKLDTFIHEIINYSRNSRTEISMEKIDVHLLVEETLAGLKFLEGYTDLEKKVTITQTAPFFSDIFRLKIILNNLLSNAIKYRSALATNAYVVINIDINEHAALFEFTDNGMGIAAESVDKIFNMFYRASEISKGSGIGLYIVKDAIHALKGKINVRSQLGEGTSFIVELPNNI